MLVMLSNNAAGSNHCVVDLIEEYLIGGQIATKSVFPGQNRLKGKIAGQ